MNKVSKRIALLGVISPALFAVGAMAQPIQQHCTLAGNNPNIVIGGVESASSPWTFLSRSRAAARRFRESWRAAARSWS